jgi:hypothetical protein
MGGGIRIAGAGSVLANKKKREDIMPDAIAWREKAAALRAAAERTIDRVTQESLLLLADDCDAFAEEKDRSDAQSQPGPRSPA